MAKKINKQFQYSGTQTLEVLEGADNYNKWIVESIIKSLRPPIIEIGSGIGNISALIKNKKPLTLTDIDLIFVNILNEKFKNKQVFVEQFDITSLPPKSKLGKYKTVLGINVLEHIDNDNAALRNLNKILKKDGRLILLVPAKKYAYNKLDKKLGHFRRYEKKELQIKLTDANFEIDEIKFFNMLGLFSWIIRDFFIKKNVELSKWQIKLFDFLVPFLKLVEKYINPPIGISIIVIAKPK